mmetsp:Transcript_49112/g.104849  ORF Transcript_49112/g.104849 Transcript_49112/m.104849 type:complete len:220 (-) Transcript_49112:57-716(-)
MGHLPAPQLAGQPARHDSTLRVEHTDPPRALRNPPSPYWPLARRCALPPLYARPLLRAGHWQGLGRRCAGGCAVRAHSRVRRVRRQDPAHRAGATPRAAHAQTPSLGVALSRDVCRDFTSGECIFVSDLHAPWFTMAYLQNGDVCKISFRSGVGEFSVNCWPATLSVHRVQRVIGLCRRRCHRPWRHRPGACRPDVIVDRCRSWMVLSPTLTHHGAAQV